MSSRQRGRDPFRRSSCMIGTGQMPPFFCSLHEVIFILLFIAPRRDAELSLTIVGPLLPVLIQAKAIPAACTPFGGDTEYPGVTSTVSSASTALSSSQSTALTVIKPSASTDSVTRICGRPAAAPGSPQSRTPSAACTRSPSATTPPRSSSSISSCPLLVVLNIFETLSGRSAPGWTITSTRSLATHSSMGGVRIPWRARCTWPGLRYRVKLHR